MISHLLRTSPAAAVAAMGLPVGMVTAVLAWALGSGWIAATLAGLVAAALVGVLISRIGWAHRGTVRRAAGDLPADVLAAADRAAQGGPVPTDPEVRAAAARIAEEQLDMMRRGSPLLMLNLLPVLAVPMLVSASTGQSEVPLFAAVPALLAGISALLLSLHLVTTPRRLRKRLQLLAGP